MATVQQGKAFVIGTGAGTYTGYDTAGSAMSTGYVTNKIPATEGVGLTQNADVERVQDGYGDIVAVIMRGEYFEATFDFRPEGSTTANALGAATLPPVGATFVIAGLPVVAAGPFADIFNTATDASGAKRWIYEGGGQLRLTNTGKGMTTLPLRRYFGIPAPAAAILDPAS